MYRPTIFYNIHQIVTVESEVALPELTPFATQKRDIAPIIRVRLASEDDPAESDALPPATGSQITYDEGLGKFGFEAAITQGEPIEIVASPLLRFSPHVLYTNLVEPVLRWTFVEKGFALVHGASIAVDGAAYLITARTDTGKTTTILRILDEQHPPNQEVAFISDDLTLVGPDGRVLAYPKPLTISSHTLAAVQTPRLSRRERLTLPLQSRLHSRRGRRLAMLLARSPLPMATVNTVVQMLVPPPKYSVQRLVPSVEMAANAQLAGLFIIERGEERERELSSSQAVEIVLQNCEDAYGFPPYHRIAQFLYERDGTDLRGVERQIITRALRGRPATLISNPSFDWWRPILARTTNVTEPILPQPVLSMSGSSSL